MKRILSIFVVIMLIFSSITVMADTKKFSDVEAGYPYETAIYSLVNFGILKGDAGADTFRPTAGISREEFSVVMIRCLGMGSITVNITEYPFTDVTPATCDDWSINATKLAYDQGIIKGMGDGTFAPKSPVTYEQAVKMIVCALGYEHHAIQAGGWPVGYLNVARELGITKNANYANSEPAPRGIIAQLVYNSLEIDLMAPSVDSTGNPVYSSVPGQNLLTQKLGLIKNVGVVTAIQNTALGSNALGVDADEVKIDTDLFKIGETNANDYLGQSVTYYYSLEDGFNTLKSVLPTHNNNIYTLSSDEIKSITNLGIEYYEDITDTADVSRYDLDTPAYLIYNGAYASLTSPVSIESGSAKLIDNDGDGLVNVITVDSAVTVMVSAVDTTNYIVYDAYDQSNKIELNPNSSDVINITKNSSKVDFTSIRKGDVLLYSKSSNATGSLTKNVKIITNTISGVISAMSSSNDEVVINNITYKLSPKFLNYVNTHSDFKFAIDNMVKCYLYDNNKIIAAEILSVSAASTFNYGYLVAAEVYPDKENAQFRIFSDSNKMITFTIDGRIKINNQTKNYDESVDAIINAGSFGLTNKDSAFSDASGYNLCQLVKYSTNSSGKLDSITTLKTSGDAATDLVLSKSNTVDKYSKDLNMLGNSVFVNDSTKIFFIPSERTSHSSYSVKQKSALINNKTYEFEAYNASATNVAPIIVIYGNSGSLEVTDPSAPLVIVDTITQVMVNGISVNKLVCYENGSKSTYNTTSTSVLSGISTGDVIRIQFDSYGQISNAKPMYDAGSSPEFSKRLVREGTNSTTMNAEYLSVFGHVYGRDDARMTVSLYDIDSDGNLDGTNLYSLPFSGETKYYLFDTERNTISDASINSIAGYSSARTGASKVFVYSTEGKTKFILIIK